MYLKPAEYVVYIFGGVRATARQIGRSMSSVSKWNKPRYQRGAEGNVPSAAARVILKIAQERKLDITPSDLMWGREVPQVQQARMAVQHG